LTLLTPNFTAKVAAIGIDAAVALTARNGGCE